MPQALKGMNDSRMSREVRQSEEYKDEPESPEPRRSSSSESKRSFHKSEPGHGVREKQRGKSDRMRVQSEQDLPKHPARPSRKHVDDNPPMISPRAHAVVS